MKFGSQLRSKSVPEWRSYNIDYNELKQQIRLATQDTASCTDLLKTTALYENIIEQIDTVNLFLSSKIGEVKRRILYIEDLIESIQANNAILDIIISQLTKLNKDLRNLARFISVQKTALRKLLKKYTKYSNDDGQLNAKVNRYMIRNPSSFIYVDISGFYLEMSLIYDLVRNISGDTDASSDPIKRRTSHANPIEKLSKNDAFDFESVKESILAENFLVHYDNLAELKLFLLANFFFIDDSTSNQVKNLQQMKNHMSTLSLRELLNTPFEPATTTKKQQITNNETEECDKSQLSNTEEYRSNSIYLNQEDALLTSSSLCTQILLDDPKQFQSIKNNQDPGSLLTDQSNTNIDKTSFLISAIGGLRKCSNVTLSHSTFTTALLTAVLNNETYESFYRTNEKIMASLDSLEKVSIEWLFTKHIKPVLKVRSTKTRFSGTTTTTTSATSMIISRDISTKKKNKIWISLSSNIEFDINDLQTTDWTSINDTQSIKFPYAHLCIRYNTTLNASEESPPLQELLDSHLIYKIDPSFNLLTYSLYHYGKLPFQPTWMKLFGSGTETIDIRKLPTRTPTRPKKSRATSFGSGITNYSGESESGSVSGFSGTASNLQLRYWNEFDHGSDYEDNDGGFMIDSGGYEEEYDDEAGLFSSGNVDAFYKMSFRLAKWLNWCIPGLFDPIIDEDDTEAHRLLENRTSGGLYGAVMSDGSENNEGDDSRDSDNDSLFLATRYHKYEQQRYRNDKFKLFLSLASSVFADFITVITTIIIFSVFAQEGIVVGKLVFGVVLASIVIALFFSSLALVLLLNIDDAFRNAWQTGFVWCSFFMVCTLIILGVVRVFEV